MSHKFRSLMLRGTFGVGLAVLAVTGAATQALGFDGDWRIDQGRLVLTPRSETSTAPLCATLAHDRASLARALASERG